MKKDKINTIFAMFIIIFVLFICSIVKIINLKNENKMLKETNIEMIEMNIAENIELVSCYLCDGTVKIQPVNDIFYIECEDCGLRTDFFKSKGNLTKYWNKE